MPRITMMPESSANQQLERLIQQYGRLIKSVIRKVAGSWAASIGEDIEQEVHLALWQHVSRELDIHHPASYIYKAAVRVTVRRLRREWARRQQPLDELTGAPSDDASHDPHSALEAKERAARLHAVVDGLPPDRRLAVRAHLQGFDVSDMMQMYGWSYQKARNLVARGISDVRQRLREDVKP